MPPRRKSARTAGPSNTVDVQFVSDPEEILPQEAVEATPAQTRPPPPIEVAATIARPEGLPSAMVSSIVAAVQTALRENSESSTNEAPHSANVCNVVNDAVQHDVASITRPAQSGSEILPLAPLFASIGVPLGSRLSARIKNKIWSDEFINFGSLLDTSPNPDKFSLSISAPPVASAGSETPNFTFEPVNNAKKLTSVHDWVSALHAFVAVYSQKFPNETPNLMQFAETVRDIAARGGDWNYYDEQFRYLRQGSPHAYPWGVVHWELWHRAVTFRAKSNSFDRSNSRFKGKQPFSRGVCFTFNAGRPCAGCRYDHKCSKCGGRHAATSCQSSNAHKPAAGNRVVATPNHTKQPSSNTGKSIHP